MAQLKRAKQTSVAGLKARSYAEELQPFGIANSVQFAVQPASGRSMNRLDPPFSQVRGFAMGFQMGRVSVELCLAPLSGQFGQDPCENIQAIPLRLAFLRALCRQYSTDAPR